MAATSAKNLLLSPILGVAKIMEDTIDSVRQITEKVRTGENTYLSNNFRPVTEEVTNLKMTVLVGQMPKDLRGAFLRNGPNPVYTPKGLYHWFDGDGMVHSVRLNGSKAPATYTNHQIQTRKLAYEKKTGGADWLGVGDMKGPLGLIKMGLFQVRQVLGDVELKEILEQPPDGVANTSIKYHAGKLMACSEMFYPTTLSMNSNTGELSTIGTYYFNEELKHHWTAHPKIDPVTNEMMSFCYNIDKAPYANYTVVNENGVIVKTLDLHLSKPIMMHDFSITTNYTIFMDLPLVFDPSNMAKRLDGGAFVFKPDEVARFGVLPRHATSTDEMVWFTVKPCAVFHVINSYEMIVKSDAGEDHLIIVLHACRFTEIDLSNIDITDGDLKNYNEVYQWKLNMTTGQVDLEEPLVKRPIGKEDECCLSGDFPQINGDLVGQKHRYCYLSRFSPEHNTKFDGIIKVDCEKGIIVDEFVYGDNERGGEIVFVEKENAISEDDGYLLGFVHNEKTDVSTFWVVDALTMTTVCICKMPKRVPFGMHATFLTEKQLTQVEKTAANQASSKRMSRL
jgi:carotenoid cleavage dioxygenase-like enzyme